MNRPGGIRASVTLWFLAHGHEGNHAGQLNSADSATTSGAQKALAENLHSDTFRNSAMSCAPSRMPDPAGRSCPHRPTFPRSASLPRARMRRSIVSAGPFHSQRQRIPRSGGGSARAIDFTVGGQAKLFQVNEGRGLHIPGQAIPRSRAACCPWYGNPVATRRKPQAFVAGGSSRPIPGSAGIRMLVERLIISLARCGTRILI